MSGSDSPPEGETPRADEPGAAEADAALEEFAAKAAAEPAAAAPPGPASMHPAAVTPGGPLAAATPGPQARPPSGESAPPHAGRPSPFDHLLTIRGDVGPTQAVALFLGGLVGLLLVWGLLTAGTPDPRQHTLTVGPDGKLTLPDAFDPSHVDVIVDGLDEDEQAGGGPPAPERFRVLAQGGAVALELSPSLAGQEVTVGYDLGTTPVVSPFILPKPVTVLTAIVELTTGDAYQVQCPYRDCASRPGYLQLGAGPGSRLEDYAEARKGADPASVAAPDVSCPRCQRPLAAADVPPPVTIPLPPHNFRRGLLATIKRTAIGFLCAAALCIPLGVLAGAFPPVKRVVSPLEITGGYTPPVALLPLAMVVAAVLSDPSGVGFSPTTANEFARVGFLVLVTSFMLYPLVTKEVEAVDQVFVNTAYMLGATRTQVVLRVLFPVAKGNIWEHLRASYAIGWASILLAEYAVGKVAGERGLGLFMEEMQRRHKMDNYFASLLAIVATGITVDWLFRVVGRLLFPYREGR